MKNNTKLNLLDCTLRDGGYYNDYLFIAYSIDTVLLQESAKINDY